MAAKYISRQDRRDAVVWLNRYVQAGHQLSLIRYKRLTMWLDGWTLRDIAKSEGDVSSQAVSQSVHRDYALIKEFATGQH